MTLLGQKFLNLQVMISLILGAVALSWSISRPTGEAQEDSVAALRSTQMRGRTATSLGYCDYVLETVIDFVEASTQGSKDVAQAIFPESM